MQLIAEWFVQFKEARRHVKARCCYRCFFTWRHHRAPARQLSFDLHVAYMHPSKCHGIQQGIHRFLLWRVFAYVVRLPVRILPVPRLYYVLRHHVTCAYFLFSLYVYRATVFSMVILKFAWPVISTVVVQC